MQHVATVFKELDGLSSGELFALVAAGRDITARAEAQLRALARFPSRVPPDFVLQWLTLDAVACARRVSLRWRGAAEGVIRLEVLELRHREDAFVVSPPTYMPQHKPELNHKMRSILFDWMIAVHLKYKLKPRTLYVAASLVDRFLASGAQVPRVKLQLLGVAAMGRTRELQGVDQLDPDDLAYITANAYTAQEVVEMERRLENFLDVSKMDDGSPLDFVTRYLGYLHPSVPVFKDAELIASYVCERMLLEYEMLKYRPSLIAACAVYIAGRNVTVAGDGRAGPIAWRPALSLYTQYSEGDLFECLERMDDIFKRNRRWKEKGRGSGALAVEKKYGVSRFGRIAKRELLILGDNPAIPWKLHVVA